GEYLAIGDSRGAASFWSLPRRQFSSTIVLHRGPLSAFAFTPDGRRFVTGGQDHGVADTALSVPGKATSLGEYCRGHQGAVHAVLMPGGDAALTGSIDGTIRLWDLKTHRESRVLKA